MIVLSHFQANHLLRSRHHTSSVLISPDLGLSSVEVILEDVVIFPDGEQLSWQNIAEIGENENKCFFIENGDISAIQEFSEIYNRVYTLYPTESAPTMLVSGIPMHRIKGTNPWDDTKNKIKALGRVNGHILDTTTGLGYTAIMAADSAELVTTIELDPQVQKIARKNPWSLLLFTHPRIQTMIGDSFDVIKDFDDETYAGIIHDPPMFSLAGSLYSQAFYQQLYRVLKSNGRMFHYIGNPKSKSGSRLTRGVVERLKKAGFSQVIRRENAFGVVAYK